MKCGRRVSESECPHAADGSSYETASKQELGHRFFLHCAPCRFFFLLFFVLTPSLPMTVTSTWIEVRRVVPPLLPLLLFTGLFISGNQSMC